MRERTTLLVSLTVLGGLAAGSYWLAERAHQGDGTRAPLRHEPDYIVERFEMTRMDLQGVPQYSMNAQQMTHYAGSSFLVSCYLLDANTPLAKAYLSGTSAPLPWTALYALEVRNAFELGVFPVC